MTDEEDGHATGLVRFRALVHLGGSFLGVNRSGPEWDAETEAGGKLEKATLDEPLDDRGTEAAC